MIEYLMGLFTGLLFAWMASAVKSCLRKDDFGGGIVPPKRRKVQGE